MCDRIAHRGPDGAGQYIHGPAALGHRRLSIIDVSGGGQPLGNEDGSVQIVFNGEIYNYQDLVHDLMASGHRFHTRSDTEAIVHLYEDAAERTPESLNGMFAFAIWDDRRQTLFLARDRFGEKPLYWTTAIPGLRIAFASELKALLTIPGFDARVNPRSIAEFLNVGYIADPDTIYEDVHKLEAGRWLRLTPDELRIERYWKPEYSQSGLGYEAAVDEVDHLCAEAARMRMVSDVPLGGFLSGGVDSSAVVAYMARSAPDRVKSFSIGFTSKKFNETEFARMVAAQWKTDHHEEVVTPDISEMLGVLIEHYDEPFGDSSAIPTLYLSRMTRRHVTVALSGDGADELFGGYRRYWLGEAEHRGRRVFPDWFRRSVFRTAGELYPKFDYLPRFLRAKSTLQGLAVELPEAYYRSMSQFRDDGLAGILAPDLRREMAGYSTQDKFCGRFRNYSHLPALTQMMAVDLETFLSGDILVKVDRATMAYSLESRAPWLDHRLQKLGGSLPPSYHLRGATGKYLFKTAVGRHLPPDVIWRKKMGFSVPLGEWFRGPLKPLFDEVALAPAMDRYIDRASARGLLDEHVSGVKNHDPRLWNLLMLAAWDRRWRDPGAENIGRRGVRNEPEREPAVRRGGK